MKTSRRLSSLFFFIATVFVQVHAENATNSESNSNVNDFGFIKNLDQECEANIFSACSQREVVDFVDEAVSHEDYEIMKGIKILRATTRKMKEDLASDAVDLSEYVTRRIADYTADHVIRLDLNSVASTARSARLLFGFPKWFSIFDPTETGKSSFLTGFGLGFLAFGLKKLLLPFFIAAQIAKSVLIAMFLPSILGGLGKIVGKGVTNFAQTSSGLSGGFGGLSGGGGLNGEATNTIEDFEFKDNAQTDYENQDKTAESKYSFNYPDQPYSGYRQPTGTLPASSLYAATNNKRYPPHASSKVSLAHNENPPGNYYQRHQAQKQDYKIFHNIPASSLLLTNYDPFYSPLLSRLDSVFKQLGYESESCRERLVCSMYRNPAKFAPYSNLVSAQLSRELNELRKPSSDNPDILRFFRYMKAAKDGQDGLDCFVQNPTCNMNSAVTHPPMVKTYNDINKLVHARRLAKQMAEKAEAEARQIAELKQMAEAKQTEEQMAEAKQAEVVQRVAAQGVGVKKEEVVEKQTTEGKNITVKS